MGIRALSDATGLNRGYLSRLERGLITKSDAVKVRSIAGALRVPPAAITHKETTT